MGLIRLLLALAVLLIMHSTPLFGIQMIGGAGAVQGFYVISGFYMALVLNEKYASNARGYREFIGQRLLRLLPTYWFCLVLSILLGATALGTVLPKTSASAPWTFWREHAGSLPFYQLVLLVFSQVFLIGQDLMLFLIIDPAGRMKFVLDTHTAITPAYQFLFVGTAWSLGVEMAFYLVAPFIVRRRWPIVAVIALCSVGVRLAVWRGLHRPLGLDPWVYRFFPSELATFLLGSIGYRVYAAIRSKPLMARKIGWIAWIGMLIAIFALPLLPLKGARPAVFFLMMAACVPFIFALTKDWKWDRWIGELSYPIYLFHFVAGEAVAKRVNAHAMEDVKGWQLLLATIPIAILIRLWIEQPMDRLRVRMRDRHRESADIISPAPM